MKTRSPLPRTAVTIIAAVVALIISSVAGRAAATNVVANTNSSTKAEGTFPVQPPFVEPPIPQAAFDQPKTKADGKDPFYPRSVRPYGVNPNPVKTGPVPVVAEFVLRGISGTPEHPLAIINTTTFTVGETNEVLTKAGRMSIQCLEINMAEGTVLIQFGGERQGLRLPSAK
jgi:hypothetical protein